MLRGNEVLFIDQITGTHRLRTVSAVGEIFPLTNTANGKACLMQLDDERALELIKSELASGRGAKGRTAGTILEEIIEMRRKGVSFNLDEKYRFRIWRYRQRLTRLRGDLEECSIKKLARGSANLA